MAPAVERKNAEEGIVARSIFPMGRLLRSPVAGQPQAVCTCSRLASCRNAICGTARCDGSGLLACDRRQLRRPVQAAEAPTISLCPGSSGFGLRAFAPIQILDLPRP